MQLCWEHVSGLLVAQSFVRVASESDIFNAMHKHCNGMIVLQSRSLCTMQMLCAVCPTTRPCRLAYAPLVSAFCRAVVLHSLHATMQSQGS